MAPGRIGTHEQDQIGGVQIVISAWYDIFTKCAIVRSHCAGHAKPRIGIDIGTANEAFHQLVGNVIVFRQQLSGNVECNAVGSMLFDTLLHPACDLAYRIAPTGGLPTYFRNEQATA